MPNDSMFKTLEDPIAHSKDRGLPRYWRQSYIHTDIWETLTGIHAVINGPSSGDIWYQLNTMKNV